MRRVKVLKAVSGELKKGRFVRNPTFADAAGGTHPLRKKRKRKATAKKKRNTHKPRRKKRAVAKRKNVTHRPRRKAGTRNPDSPQWKRYYRLQKAAGKADDQFQKELQKVHGRSAGDARYRPQTSSRLRALQSRKRKLDDAMRKALDVARKNPKAHTHKKRKAKKK